MTTITTPETSGARQETRSYAPEYRQPRITPALREHAAELRRWLFGEALPLWGSAGLDEAGGGFHESLSPSGEPLRVAKRARVQARQAYVFATAGMLGWEGPWREAALAGVDQLERVYRRPDGLFRTLVSPEGAPLDETARLYDHAFVLLAQARLRAADLRPEAMEAQAAALRDALRAFRHAGIGFRETSDRPFQANAHMHLLEAAMEWTRLSLDPAWRALCEEIVELALTRFVDERTGQLLEVFDAEWRPAPGEAGKIVEPGHQFEWAWLLERWWTMSADRRAMSVAAQLRTSGLAGVDPQWRVALDEVRADGGRAQRTARLWPQTEWLKAALDIPAEHDGAAVAEAACEALRRYLDTPVKGLWWDRVMEDGRMQVEPAPASSFYHIVTACSELFRATGAADPARPEDAADGLDVAAAPHARQTAPSLGALGN